MTECDEVAYTMATQPLPHFPTMDAARHYVRDRMGDQGMQIIDNVAETLFRVARYLEIPER